MQIELLALQPNYVGGMQMKAALVEYAARNCYQSKQTTDDESRAAFLKSLSDREHMSVFEHAWYTFRWDEPFHEAVQAYWPVRRGSVVTPCFGNGVLVSANARALKEMVGINYVVTPTNPTGEPYLNLLGLNDITAEERYYHTYATFKISGVSITCERQMIRHRSLSFSNKSLRYVDVATTAEFRLPQTIAENTEAIQVYLDATDHAKDAYDKMRELGIPKEDARFTLPLATTTDMVVSGTYPALHHFIDLRTSSKAQWEIREVATEMRRMLSDSDPIFRWGLELRS